MSRFLILPFQKFKVSPNFCKVLSFLMFFVGSTLSVHAQLQPYVMRNMQQYLFKDNYKMGAIQSGYENVKGSPFVQADFVKGDVYTSNGNFMQVDMRFDAFEGTFALLLDGKVTYLDQTESIQKVSLGGTDYFLKNIGTAVKPKVLFMALLYKGQLSLFAKHNVNLRPEEPPRAMETEVRPAQFVKQNDSYYLQMGSGNILRIESFKDFGEIFADKAESIKAYVKQEKLNFKKQEDIIKLVKFCNGA